LLFILSQFPEKKRAEFQYVRADAHFLKAERPCRKSLRGKENGSLRFEGASIQIKVLKPSRFQDFFVVKRRSRIGLNGSEQAVHGGLFLSLKKTRSRALSPCPALF
jgi:hypothetical protein